MVKDLTIFWEIFLDVLEGIFDLCVTCDVQLNDVNSFGAVLSQFLGSFSIFEQASRKNVQAPGIQMFGQFISNT
jgi:hypothetical protein